MQMTVFTGFAQRQKIYLGCLVMWRLQDEVLLRYADAEAAHIQAAIDKMG